MKYHARVEFASTILRELKEKNFSIKYDLYSRLLRLIYNNNQNIKEVENNLMQNFNNFTDLSESGSIYEKEQKPYRSQKENNVKPRRHFYNNFN
jgi:hypothetical protein